MPWKIYTVIFFVINVVSLVVFDYKNFQLIPFVSLLLSAGLNIAVFSYAFKKPILSKQLLIWLYKLNVGLLGLYLLLEFFSFIQEIVGSFGISTPVSGVVSLIASTPSLPALYATYKLAYPKANKPKKKSKKKS